MLWDQPRGPEKEDDKPYLSCGCCEANVGRGEVFQGVKFDDLVGAVGVVLEEDEETDVFEHKDERRETSVSRRVVASDMLDSS
jgi:hypothetical protein